MELLYANIRVVVIKKMKLTSNRRFNGNLKALLFLFRRLQKMGSVEILGIGTRMKTNGFSNCNFTLQGVNVEEKISTKGPHVKKRGEGMEASTIDDHVGKNTRIKQNKLN